MDVGRGEQLEDLLVHALELEQLIGARQARAALGLLARVVATPATGRHVRLRRLDDPARALGAEARDVRAFEPVDAAAPDLRPAALAGVTGVTGVTGLRGGVVTAKDGWRGAVRTAVLENMSLKVLSLVCALGVYAFIHGAENVQRTMAVSVVSVMPPENANRQLLSPLPTEVAVTVQGSRTHLDDLRAEDLGSLQLDLRSGRETRIDLDNIARSQ